MDRKASRKAVASPPSADDGLCWRRRKGKRFNVKDVLVFLMVLAVRIIIMMIRVMIMAVIFMTVLIANTHMNAKV